MVCLSDILAKQGSEIYSSEAVTKQQITLGATASSWLWTQQSKASSETLVLGKNRGNYISTLVSKSDCIFTPYFSTL
jgi:hypothetical protein